MLGNWAVVTVMGSACKTRPVLAGWAHGCRILFNGDILLIFSTTSLQIPSTSQVAWCEYNLRPFCYEWIPEGVASEDEYIVWKYDRQHGGVPAEIDFPRILRTLLRPIPVIPAWVLEEAASGSAMVDAVEADESDMDLPGV